MTTATMNNDSLNKIRNIFDLNLYEAKIWTALLSKGISTAGELSDIADVPRSRSYDVLESLEKKGFVIMKLTKPIKYIAISPSNVIQNFKKKVVEDAKKKAKKFESLKDSDIIKELKMLSKRNIKYIEPHEMSGVIKGRNNIYNHIAKMIREAEENIIINTSEMGFVRKIKTLNEELKKAKKKGVEIKIAANLTENNKEHISKKLGNIKNHDENTSRFFIADNKDILFLVMDDSKTNPKYDLGIWVKSENFGQSMSKMFNHMWNEL